MDTLELLIEKEKLKALFQNKSIPILERNNKLLLDFVKDIDEYLTVLDYAYGHDRDFSLERLYEKTLNLYHAVKGNGASPR